MEKICRRNEHYASEAKKEIALPDLCNKIRRRRHYLQQPSILSALCGARMIVELDKHIDKKVEKDWKYFLLNVGLKKYEPFLCNDYHDEKIKEFFRGIDLKSLLQLREDLDNYNSDGAILAEFELIAMASVVVNYKPRSAPKKNGTGPAAANCSRLQKRCIMGEGAG